MLFRFLLLLAVYLPFQIALNPIKGIDMASLRVLILILFFCWLAEGLRRKKIQLKKEKITFLIIIFLFLSFFSIFFANNFDWSGRKILYLFSIFPIYFVMQDVIVSKKQMQRIIQKLVLAGSLISVLGIFQVIWQFFIPIKQEFYFWSHYVTPIFLGKNLGLAVMTYPSWLVNIAGKTYFRAVAIFPDPHMFSFFLGLLLPLAIAVWRKEKNNKWLLAFLSIFLADILTFSRGGYFGLLAGFLFFIIILLNNKKKKYKFLIVATLILAFGLIIPNPITTRFLSSFNLQEGSNAGRIKMWQDAIKIIKEKPFYGAGIGNFPLTVNSLATYREPIYAHNTYLDISVDSGILAGLAWLSILFLAWLKFFQKRKEDIIYLGLAVSIVIFSVHSFFDTAIYSPVVLTLLLMILSFSLIKVRIKKEENSLK